MYIIIIFHFQNYLLLDAQTHLEGHVLTAATSSKCLRWQPMRKAVGTMRKSSMPVARTGT